MKDKEDILFVKSFTSLQILVKVHMKCTVCEQISDHKDMHKNLWSKVWILHMGILTGMDAPPVLWGGGGGYPPRPAPPRKNNQNSGELVGQNKGPNLNFLQYRKQMMEQYYNTEQCPIQRVNKICKRK